MTDKEKAIEDAVLHGTGYLFRGRYVSPEEVQSLQAELERDRTYRDGFSAGFRLGLAGDVSRYDRAKKEMTREISLASATLREIAENREPKP